MGVTPKEILELASYQLKDLAQVFFEQWRDEIPLWDGLVD